MQFAHFRKMAVILAILSLSCAPALAAGSDPMYYYDLSPSLIDPSLTTTLTPSGTIETTAYDTDNQYLVVDTMQAGETTVTFYDGSGNVVGGDGFMTSSQITSLSYDPDSTAYDAAGNEIVATDPVNGTVTFYDDQGTAEHTISGLGDVTRTLYDGSGEIIETTDSHGNTTMTFYDDNGNVIDSGSSSTPLTIDPVGTVTSTAYDSADKEVIVTTYDGSESKITTYQYDPGTETVSTGTQIEDVQGRITTTTYDADDKKIIATVEDPRGNTTTYAYDTGGGTGEQVNIDPVGRITTTSYDAADNRLFVGSTAPEPSVLAPFGLLGILITGLVVARRHRRLS